MNPTHRTDAELIAEHIAKYGVTRTLPDYGPETPAVESLRAGYHDVHKSRDRSRPWNVNGKPLTTAGLWAAANGDRAARGLRPLKRDKVKGTGS